MDHAGSLRCFLKKYQKVDVELEATIQGTIGKVNTSQLKIMAINAVVATLVIGN